MDHELLQLLNEVEDKVSSDGEAGETSSSVGDKVFDTRKSTKNYFDSEKENTDTRGKNLKATEEAVCSDRFDEEEKSLLINLVTENYKVLFGAFTNNITSEIKTKVWNNIKERINKINGKERSVKSVKDKWQKMTTAVKKKCSEINKLNRTSSGRNDTEIPELTQLEEQIKSTIGDVAIEGIVGGIDTEVIVSSEGETSDDSSGDLGGKSKIEIHVSEQPVPPTSATEGPTTAILHEGETTSLNALKTSKNKLKRMRYPPSHTISKPQEDSFDDTTDGTKELLLIEKRKLELLEEKVDLERKRLKVEEEMCSKLDVLCNCMSSWINKQPLPSFSGTFSPLKRNNQTWNEESQALNLTCDPPVVNSNGFTYMNLN
jgi:hypothetical protein